MLKQKLLCGLVLSSFFIAHKKAQADVFDIGFMGVSQYVGKPWPKSAPRRLSPNGERVFTPGLFVGRDFRGRVLDQGISLMVQGGFFQDYQNATSYFASIGGRYLTTIRGNFIMAGTLSVMLSNHEMYGGSRRYSLGVVPSFEFGQITRYALFDVDAIKLIFSFIPKSSNDDTPGAPSDFVMLSIAYSFSI